MTGAMIDALADNLQPLTHEQFEAWKAETEERMSLLQQQMEKVAEAESRMALLQQNVEQVSTRMTGIEESWTMSPEMTGVERQGTMRSKSSVSFKLDHTPSNRPSIGTKSSLRTPQSRDSRMTMNSISSEVWEGSSDDSGYDCRAERPYGKRGTMFGQAKIAKGVSLPLRILGIVLAFITVIFLWELTNLGMKTMFPRKEVCLVAFLSLSSLAAMCLALSHTWVLTAHSSLVPSFAYAMSTLFLAVGGWGVVETAIEMSVKKEKLLFCYAAGGFLSFVSTVLYALQTKHNVLLDIASCATTMGMYDDIEEGDYDGL
jgi:hypothetical protein